MKLVPRSLQVRPRLVAALAALALLAIALPGDWRWPTRLLIAWDAGAILYLVLLATTMFTESVEQIRARAEEQDEGALAILIIASLAATMSLVAIAAQFAGLGSVPPSQKIWHFALGGITVLCSWTLLHAFFTLHYAGSYYRGGRSEPCLDFPGTTEPDYLDFLYFAYTVGCTSQTSDVAVTTRQARGVVLLHSILAFVFNTSILALGINVGASLVSGGP